MIAYLREYKASQASEKPWLQYDNNKEDMKDSLDRRDESHGSYFQVSKLLGYFIIFNWHWIVWKIGFVQKLCH